MDQLADIHYFQVK